MTDRADAQTSLSFFDETTYLEQAENPKDASQLVQEISGEIIESILASLNGSILTKYIAKGVYGKLASRFDREGFDKEGAETGIVLQEIALNIYAIINKGSFARHGDQFNHLANPTRTNVEQLVEHCVTKLRSVVFGFVMGDRLKNSVDHFADRFYREYVQLTDPLVANILQEV